MGNYTALSDLAVELGLDRSNMRKYALKHGFEFRQVRTTTSRGQLVLALSPEDAEAVRELRQAQGFGVSGEKQGVVIGPGWFYTIQVVPDLDPLRIKLGFALDPFRRLDAYRTLSPTACILKTWRCQTAWEQAAIASITRCECESIGGEVFRCSDLKTLIVRGDNFFNLMPTLAQ